MDMELVSKKMSHDWAASYIDSAKNKEELNYPSETLVRLFKGDYVTGVRHNMEGKSVLDMGFGLGNNTVFLASLGMNVSGVEIHQSICDQVSDVLTRKGLSADLRIGANRAIPYPDNHFDYLVSWNVLHYEGTEANVCAGIKEYARVLKPGGRLFLSTTGPTHKILLNSTTHGGHQYEIGRSDDFRQGQMHFFFDAPNYIEYYFSSCFRDLQIGRIEDTLFQDKLDWWLITGIK